jgi:hypothetical protein
MNKSEVLHLMNDVVNHLNRQIGQANNLTDNQIEEAILQHQESLTFINGVIYDELVKHGVIS